MENIPLTRIQKLIGERMLKSKLSKPCFYIASRADVTDMMALRPGLKKSLGVKITTDAFYIRALALAAKECPLMAGTIDGGAGDNIRIADRINVGFAVNAPQGLVVPVIKNADKKTLAEIARLEKTLTEAARSNRLTPEQMQGETIALSNLGPYGIDSFIGIVPPSVSTILAVGNVVRIVCPQPSGADAKQVRKMIALTLAADHRIINGTYAARFLNLITEHLQNPQQLV